MEMATWPGLIIFLVMWGTIMALFKILLNKQAKEYKEKMYRKNDKKGGN